MMKDAAPWRGARALLLALLAMACWAGCSPEDFLVGDEDRDRNLQRARDSERLGEYEAAAEYYERALERSGRSPAVHLGYAALCEARLQRFPDAVYHYQRYLRLLPAGDARADDIRQRITNCTERLATTVPLMVRSETIARDLAAVRSENLGLRAQITNLSGVLGQWSNECQRLTLVVTQMQVQAQAQALALAQAQAARAVGAVTGGGGGRVGGVSQGSGWVPGTATGPAPGVAGPRFHRVSPGETLDRISRQYRIPLRSLQQANPRVDARRLRPGTELRIPAR
jgi:tetratricopeptide (TPR) repeat protein